MLWQRYSWSVPGTDQTILWLFLLQLLKGEREQFLTMSDILNISVRHAKEEIIQFREWKISVLILNQKSNLWLTLSNLVDEYHMRYSVYCLDCPWLEQWLLSISWQTSSTGEAEYQPE